MGHLPETRRSLSAALLAGSCALVCACSKAPRAAYRTDAVSRGPVAEVVSATGTVSAIITVNIGSQVSGTIAKLHVDFNSPVKKGQLLAEIDPSLFRAQLEKAQAGLASAQANLEKAQVTLSQAQRDEVRQKSLLARGLISQADVDVATTARENDAAALGIAKAQVLQARADRDLAATNLAYTRIQSPIDGIVVSRSIDVGQTVASAFQAPTLFVIANDLTRMQILAAIDEADVGKVHEGEEATFSVDAYPGEEFRGKIREVRQAPDTVQNVVTYAAVIDAPNPEHKLRQGMTASVQVTSARRSDALRVANAALRWKPEGGAEDGRPAPEDKRNGRGGGAIPAAHAEGRPGREGRSAAGAPAGPGRPGRAYRLVNGQPEQVELRLGISDGQRTEVLSGLAEGDAVIVGLAEAGGPPKKGQARRGPF